MAAPLVLYALQENTTMSDAPLRATDIAFVYLMVDHDHTRFKIGFSIDPLQRRKQIATKIDLDASMRVDCAPNDVRRLEKVLHAWFADFRIDPALIDDPDGRTEWFHYHCLTSVLSYLHEHHAWLRCTLPAPIHETDTERSVQRLPKRKAAVRRVGPKPQPVRAELGDVASMAELMARAESSTGKSLLHKSVTVCLGRSARPEDNMHGFGRLLWEAGGLQKLGIIKVGRVDLQGLSFTFMRLNNDSYNTDELYAIKPISS